MRAVGELVLDYSAYRRIVQSPRGIGARLLPGVGVIFLFCSGVLAFAPGMTLSGKISILMLSLLMTFTRELLMLLGWQQARKLTDRPWRYEITDSTVGIHTSQTSVTVAWGGISRTRTRRHAWVLTMTSRRSLIVPRAAFSAAAQREIDQFLQIRSAY